MLDHLLGMADMYARNGSLRQAIELYFTLIIEHDGTEQSVQACDRIMAVAQRYESNGELRSGSWNLRTTPESELSDGGYDRTVA